MTILRPILGCKNLLQVQGKINLHMNEDDNGILTGYWANVMEAYTQSCRFFWIILYKLFYNKDLMRIFSF